MAAARRLMLNWAIKETDWLCPWQDRTKITPAEYLALWLYAECKCTYCKQDLLMTFDNHYGGGYHMDHILPRSLHPELWDTLQNLTLVCYVCSGAKSNWDPSWALELHTPTVTKRDLYIAAAKNFVLNDRQRSPFRPDKHGSRVRAELKYRRQHYESERAAIVKELLALHVDLDDRVMGPYANVQLATDPAETLAKILARIQTVNAKANSDGH